MSIRGKAALVASLALVEGIAACSSSPPRSDIATAMRRFNQPTDPYWLDSRWDRALLEAAQAVVHDPAVAVTDMATQGPHVTINFTFADGVIKDPDIISGTGDPVLDELLLKQVVMAQVPKPIGLHADEAHGFLLDLDMLTPFESFQSSIYSAVSYYKIYPKDAIISGAIGATTVDFDYLDGKANGISITKSSHDRILDKASFDTVAKAIMPTVPQPYAGKTLHMEVILCYALNDPRTCPVAKNVILVFGTRTKTVAY
jgi:hypothetical protein